MVEIPSMSVGMGKLFHSTCQATQHTTGNTSHFFVDPQQWYPPPQGQRQVANETDYEVSFLNNPKSFLNGSLSLLIVKIEFPFLHKQWIVSSSRTTKTVNKDFLFLNNFRIPSQTWLLIPHQWMQVLIPPQMVKARVLKVIGFLLFSPFPPLHFLLLLDASSIAS